VAPELGSNGLANSGAGSSRNRGGCLPGRVPPAPARRRSKFSGGRSSGQSINPDGCRREAASAQVPTGLSGRSACGRGHRGTAVTAL